MLVITLFMLSQMVPILVNMALLTLLERKLMGLSQTRVGPNKVGAWGGLQPVADAVKLFSKMNTLVGSSIKPLYYFSPVMGLALSLLLAAVLPSFVGGISLEFQYLIIMVVFSLGVYPVMVAGWSSNSKYSTLGGVRSVAQTISYEIGMAFILMGLFLFLGSYSSLLNMSLGKVSAGWFMPGVILWGVVCMVELNRTPFDLSEGESELVSGFNTEYGSSKFAMIFMAEYVSILVMSALTATIILGMGWMSGALATMGAASVVVWARVTFPRVRYDVLMGASWKTLLPWSLALLMLMSMWALPSY